jgi:hypothetical protein
MEHASHQLSALMDSGSIEIMTNVQTAQLRSNVKNVRKSMENCNVHNVQNRVHLLITTVPAINVTLEAIMIQLQPRVIYVLLLKTAKNAS